jgi:dolichyl-phosphate-mannose--protein O-mannosyl transferase
LLIGAGVLLWGENSYGWRFPSALFGAAGIVVTYLLALATTRRKGVAFLASALLLADGLYFVQSRIGMLDIFGTVFMMGALISLHRYLTSAPERIKPPLLLIGTFLGLALATKWNAAYASVLVGVVVLYRTLRLWQATRMDGAPDETRKALKQHLVWVPLGLLVVPIAVYLAAYIPFFLAGHNVAQFVELQKQIYFYHSRLQATHPFQSKWWHWPLTMRPVWYYLAGRQDKTANIYAFGNPVLYWAFIPAILWSIYKWWKSYNPALVVLAIGFLGQWLPWSLVPRIAFQYHFLPAVPFGCIAVALSLADLVQKGFWPRLIAVVYVCLVLLSFGYLYPIYAAVPLSQRAVEVRMWLWR